MQIAIVMSSASNIRGDATISKIKKAFRDNLCCGLGRLEAFATKHDIYVALALTVRDRLLQRTVESVQAYIARLLPCGVAC